MDPQAEHRPRVPCQPVLLRHHQPLLQRGPGGLLTEFPMPYTRLKNPMRFENPGFEKVRFMTP